jgi:hypothetical protein|tara:strand:+ start:271 stop:840 length:570 start_codon:yes stop_codon:yes gene_type:complete
MAFKLSDGTLLPLDSPFTIGEINYPSNFLRLSTEEEKKALGITEVADSPNYDSRFYTTDGKAKTLSDVNETYDHDAEDGSYKKGDLVKDKNGNQVVILGVKSSLKNTEKDLAGGMLRQCDWYVVRKAEKGTAIPSTISTYRDAVRTANATREAEIDACSDTASLVTLYSFKEDGTPNMTQYPETPDSLS